MKKLIFSFLSLLTVLVTLPTLVTAQNPQAATTTSGTTWTVQSANTPLVHAYKPFVVSQATGNQTMPMQDALQARVNNWTSTPQNRLVCVEAMGSRQQHLGCLRVELQGRGSTDGMWAREFNTPLNTLNPGTYKIMYNYQDDSGMWRQVPGINGQMVNTTISSR